MLYEVITVKDSLSKGENVYLRGFGSFIVKERAEKTGRNISKNTSIIIPAHVITSYSIHYTKLYESLRDEE